MQIVQLYLDSQYSYKKSHMTKNFTIFGNKYNKIAYMCAKIMIQ